MISRETDHVMRNAFGRVNAFGTLRRYMPGFVHFVVSFRRYFSCTDFRTRSGVNKVDRRGRIYFTVLSGHEDENRVSSKSKGGV